MRRSAAVALPALAAAAFAVAAAPASAAYETPIKAGVSAGGVDLGGLTVDAAVAKLTQTLGPRFSRQIVVAGANRKVVLTAKQADVTFDATTTAKRAWIASYRGAGADQPVTDPGGGVPVGIAVPLAISHAKAPVRAFVARVGQAMARAPRNATLTITLRHMKLHASRTGRALRNPSGFARRIDAALDNPASAHFLRPPLRHLRAATSVNDLKRIYGTVVTVDRSNFKLRLFKRLKLRKTYGVAVGMAGLDTPAGIFHVQDKQVNPAWHVPMSPWAGSLQGQTIPGGAPNNPLKARWLGVADGVGIHGTAEDWSIGSRASHGCIRMHVSDVIDLYSRVPVGAPVLIR